MSTALGYLFLLLPVAAIAWIVWSYRRKAGDKEARSREREAVLVGTGQVPRVIPRGGIGTVQVSLAAAAPAALMGSGGGGAAAATVAARRDRFLTQPETLVYYLLRTGMPGYEIFPRVSLASVLTFTRTVSGRSGDLAPRGTHDLDFVVCDKSMRIVAAIQLAGRQAMPDAPQVAQDLAAAGIRLVRVDPAALPRREQVGALILGPTG